MQHENYHFVHLSLQLSQSFTPITILYNHHPYLFP